jgi:hypothetical protein
MAATIAKAIGYDNSRTKAVHRLGHQSSEAEANTWRTFTTCFVNKDGSGFVEVRRDGELMHRYNFPKELPHGYYRDNDGTVWKPTGIKSQDEMIEGRSYILKSGVFYEEADA